MTKDSLKRKIKEEGLAGSVLYYLGRFCSKAELALVGKWFGNHGNLRQNCIVLKNRTMQDMTDNPRAFYEYLIQNKINENYQIIWMVSDKKKCEKLKCKNVKPPCLLLWRCCRIFFLYKQYSLPEFLPL